MKSRKLLRYSADQRSILFVILYFVILLLSWTLSSHISTLGISLLILLNCLWCFFVTTIVHNTVHCPIFYKPLYNRIFQLALTLAHGNPVSGFVPGHNLGHHKFLNTPMDAARTYRIQFRWNILNQFFFPFFIVQNILISEMRYLKFHRRKASSWAAQYRLEFVTLLTFKICLILINLKLFLLLVVIPNLYALWGIFGVNYWQHDGCDSSHEFNHSRTFYGEFNNFFIFNNGYHTLHHLRPNLHWSLLPSVHEVEVKPHLHPNLNLQSLFAYLWKTCIYPAKRVDYLGNPIQLPAKDKSVEWVDPTDPGNLRILEFPGF